MEGGKCRTGPVWQLERSFECSRLAEQLLISAYEQVVPVIRHAVRRDQTGVRSTWAAVEPAASKKNRVACHP
jgi:hypothetical protein